jgi:hypothetical protein
VSFLTSREGDAFCVFVMTLRQVVASAQEMMKGHIDMRKTARLTLFLVVLLAVGGGAIACESKPASSPDENMVRDYADTATETCLQGLSDHDLVKYTEQANAEFKAAVTQEILDAAATQIDNQLGAYQTIEFLRIEEKEGYVIVHYRASYAKGAVGVRMVFDEDQLIAGQWFE